MKKMYRFVLFLVSMVLMLVAAGCEKTTTTDEEEKAKADSLAAETKANDAYALMEEQFLFAANNNMETTADFDRLDFAPANAKFKEALLANPNHGMANIGAAMTEILCAYADPTVKDAIKKWENFDPGSGLATQGLFRFSIPQSTSSMTVPVAVLGKNFIKIIQTATADPPTISEMQTILKEKLLPRVEYAITHIQKVETISNFEMRISGKMQGDSKLAPVFADMTEIYVMDAMLNGMKAIINEFLVYKFELASYTVKDIVPAIRQNNTTFFVLASNGAATAASVKTSLLTSISKIRSAINYLKSETDAQSDDVIKKGNDGVSTADLDTVLTYLNKAENSFTQAINIEVPDADIDGNDYTISVNIGKLFDNPPSNPKLQWLPPYTVDTSAHGDILWHWTQTEYATFAFPDPTLNGILPGMTNDRLKKIMGVEKEFAWQLHVWMNDQGNTLNQSSSFKIVVNGKTYYPAQNSNNYYSSFSRDFEFFVLDNLNYPVQVYAVLNGSDVALTLNKQLVTKGKTHHELNADVTRAPQNMQAFANSYPLRVDLQLNQWGTWRIDRLMGTSGTFSKIDSLMTSYYTDNTVQAKTTYTYRALRYPPNYGWEYLACRPANFTNSVTVTTP